MSCSVSLANEIVLPSAAAFLMITGGDAWAISAHHASCLDERGVFALTIPVGLRRGAYYALAQAYTTLGREAQAREALGCALLGGRREIDFTSAARALSRLCPSASPTRVFRRRCRRNES